MITVAPYQRKYFTGKQVKTELPDHDQGFETSVYGTIEPDINGETVADYSFNIDLEYGRMDTELFIDVVYQQLVDRLETDYPEADILSASENDLKRMLEPWEC